MNDKVMTASRAAAFITPGCHLGVGAGMAMNPLAVIREVIKRGTSGLTLTPVLTGGFVADLLIGVGAVAALQFPQVALDEYGPAPHFRKKAARGELKLLETI